MNRSSPMEHFFASPLFSKHVATPDQLKTYALVFWPIQVSFIVGLPKLTGVICEQIGNLALKDPDMAEERRLKAIVRYMFPPTIDELGHGRDKYGCMHHDLFAAQVQACTGLSQQALREQWVRGLANQRLAHAMTTSVQTVHDGLRIDVRRRGPCSAVLYASGRRCSWRAVPPPRRSFTRRCARPRRSSTRMKPRSS